MDELKALLAECCPTVNFEKEQHLMSEKVLDSMDIVNIMSRLEDEYEISIDYEMLTPENFDSVKQIYEMVKRLKHR